MDVSIEIQTLYAEKCNEHNHRTKCIYHNARNPLRLKVGSYAIFKLTET